MRHFYDNIFPVSDDQRGCIVSLKLYKLKDSYLLLFLQDPFHVLASFKLCLEGMYKLVQYRLRLTPERFVLIFGYGSDCTENRQPYTGNCMNRRGGQEEVN